MVGQLQRSSARAARTRSAQVLRTAAAQPGRVSSSPMRHPSSLEALLEGMALFGEPAPQTSQRRSDYCSPHGPFPSKTERELARDEERERERKRQVEREIDRTIREVSLLRERERGRELGAAGPEEEADWETAKLAVQQGTHSGRTRRQGGEEMMRRGGRVQRLLSVSLHGDTVLHMLIRWSGWLRKEDETAAAKMYRAPVQSPGVADEDTSVTRWRLSARRRSRARTKGRKTCARIATGRASASTRGLNT